MGTVVFVCVVKWGLCTMPDGSSTRSHVAGVALSTVHGCEVALARFHSVPSTRIVTSAVSVSTEVVVLLNKKRAVVWRTMRVGCVTRSGEMQPLIGLKRSYGASAASGTSGDGKVPLVQPQVGATTPWGVALDVVQCASGPHGPLSHCGSEARGLLHCTRRALGPTGVAHEGASMVRARSARVTRWP